MNSPSLTVVCRGVIAANNKVLLVRHASNDYWNLPGGHWEPETEPIKECVAREVEEETGLKVTVDKLLIVQELRSESSTKLDMIWQTSLINEVVPNQQDKLEHIDTDPLTEVVSAQWFDIETLDQVALKPEALKSKLQNLDQKSPENTFTGTFDL